MDSGELFDAVVDPNQPDNQRGGSRTGHADKPAFVHLADERVEQGEAQGGAGAVDEGDGITDFAELPKLPFVGNQRRGDTEADHIGKAVELLPERALAVGQPRHAPVHTVQQHRDEYRDGGGFIMPVHRLGNGVKGRKQGGNGKGVGQQVDAVLTQGALGGVGRGFHRQSISRTWKVDRGL